MKHKGLGLSFLLFIAGCTRPVTIDGFDRDLWVSDQMGCESKRVEQVDFLTGAGEYIVGQSEKTVIATLGAPDRNQLYRRKQKIFIYFTSQGEQCSDPESAKELSDHLFIRFNATGVVSEIYHYEK